MSQVKDQLSEPPAAVAPTSGTEAAISGVDRRYKSDDATYYHDYLQLDKILGAQHMRSSEPGRKVAHDEMMFIIVHQTYELWFKQMLHDVGSVIDIFGSFTRDDQISIAVLRLERVIEIMKVLVQQVTLIEAITPLDFLEFRDYLIPASGFQSVQFRLFEIKFGLRADDRNQYQRRTFLHYFKPEHQEMLKAAENGHSLFNAIEQWLERTPFVEFRGFKWLEAYRAAVDKMLDSDEALIRSNPMFSEEQLSAQLVELQTTRSHFATIFDEHMYKDMQEKGYRRLSHRAMQAALLIHLYRDEPIFQLPFRVLTALTTLDETISQWRHRHMAMAHRMIGNKIGTGGSSGYGYLRSTVGDKYRVFTDITSLSTFLIARSAVPPLPDFIRREIQFVWSAETKGAAAAGAL